MNITNIYSRYFNQIQVKLIPFVGIFHETRAIVYHLINSRITVYKCNEFYRDWMS